MLNVAVSYDYLTTVITPLECRLARTMLHPVSILVVSFVVKSKTLKTFSLISLPDLLCRVHEYLVVDNLSFKTFLTWVEVGSVDDT